MNSFAVLCLLAVLPICSAITCYQCTAGSSGCDPFSASGSGVSTSSSSACIKVSTGFSSGTTRSSASSCTANNIGGVGTFCCYTDYCNGATSKYQTPFLLALVIAALFAKHRFL
ncbi:unnamed protein product [Adineta ricciae]|uniref:Uncharacterized protein n=2 Tax=Adineta ricciae TaxID=249248 RepID=A0A814TQ21_ADIRI|nr:unnamed protein product [Adineta ricciae]